MQGREPQSKASEVQGAPALGPTPMPRPTTQVSVEEEWLALARITQLVLIR